MSVVSDKLGELEERYAPEEPRPLHGYLRALGVFVTYVGILSTLVTRRRGAVPPGLDTRDTILASVATFRAARLLTEASVTSPIRAAFTRYAGPGAPGEVREQVQEPEGGDRHAFAELLSCPYCLGVWVATTFGFGFVLMPRTARFAASILGIDAGADVMQKLYSDLQAR